MRQTFGPVPGNRLPAVAKPGAKKAELPTPQKGGGGNRGTSTAVVPTAENSPTVSVSPSGTITSEHFGPSPQQQRQARQARAQEQQATRRVQRVRKVVRSLASEATPKRELHVSADFLKNAASPKPVTVAAHTRALPGQSKASVPVAKHQRALPEVKGTKAQRVKARQNVEQAKAALKGPSKATLSSAIVATPEQRKVAKTVLKTGEEDHADRKEKLAALTTGLQESGLKNLPISGPGGGWRQEESEFYPAEDITNVKKGAQNYFQEARAAGRGKGETPAELSQTVQGSGAGESYYEDNQGEARQLLKQYNEGKASPQAKAQYQAAVKEAKELGLKVAPTGPQVGKPTKQTVTKFGQIKHAAAELESKNLPYSWGGGHNPTFSPGGEEENGGPGYDCSGAVSWVLHQAGVLNEPLTSGSMGSVLKPGPGAVTVFYNAGHTFMKIGNEYWGTSVGDDGAGGIGKHPTPSAEYLSQYSVGHVPGLGKKQALQLGFKPGSLTTSGSSSAAAFPGMTISEDGTSATIDKGEGIKKNGKAGFSKKPIELTPLQQIRKNVNKLKALGTEIAGPGEETRAEAANKPGSSSLHSQLQALEKKYAIGAV